MSVRAVFLDRDGVINQDPGEAYYVKTLASFRFVAGAAEAMARLAGAGFRLYVVSNQSGIARGAVKQADLDEITRHMTGELKRAGADLAGVFYCPHDDGDYCACRKPKPGLFLKAAEKGPIDFARSFNVGDSERDIQAGRAVGLKSVLVLSGKTRPGGDKSFHERPDAVKRDLKEAADWILAQSAS